MKIDLSPFYEVPLERKHAHDLEVYRKLRAFGLAAALKCDSIDENQYYERDFMISTIKLIKIFEDIPRELTSTVYIPKGDEFLEYQCIWDSGGQQSCINPQIAIDCGFEIVGAADVVSIHDMTPVDVYKVPIYIFGTENKPLELSMLGVKPISLSADVSFGIEVIATGRFELKKRSHLRMLTYELPYDKVVEFRDPY